MTPITVTFRLRTLAFLFYVFISSSRQRKDSQNDGKEEGRKG